MFVADIEWRVDFASFRGDPVLVLSALASTSRELGTLPFGVHQAQNAIAALRLHRLSPTLRALRASPAMLVSTPYGAWIAAASGSRAITLASKPPTDWLQRDCSQPILMVIAAGDPGRYRSIGEFLRSSAASGEAYGATMQVVSIDCATKIDFITAHGVMRESLPHSAKVVLDSNIVLDFYRLVTAQMTDDNERRNVLALAAELRGRDALDGFATLELSHRGGLKVDHVRAEQLVASTNVCLTAPITDLVGGELQRCYEEELRLCQRDRIADRLVDDFFFYTSNYVTLLKLALLWEPLRGRRFEPQSRVDALQQFCDFVDNDLQFSSGYASALARQVLLGRQDLVEDAIALLKFNKRSTVTSVRNAAWDVLFLFSLDWGEYGDRRSMGPAVLATRDKALRKFQDVS